MAGEATPGSDAYFRYDGRHLGGAGRDGKGARETAAPGVRPGGHRPQRQPMLRLLPIRLRRVAEDEPGSTRPYRLVALQRARRAYPQGLGLDPRGGRSTEVHANGELTLGENTADNGGARLSYEAFRTAPGAKAGSDAHGFAPEQRFFMSYAQGWCENHTEESAREDAKTNPHAPGKYRVNGVLANLEGFRKAFVCKTGTPMAPNKINRVW